MEKIHTKNIHIHMFYVYAFVAIVLYILATWHPTSVCSTASYKLFEAEYFLRVEILDRFRITKDKI